MRFYHGTDADFDVFEHSEDIGFHFAAEPANKRAGIISDRPVHTCRPTSGFTP